jgi:hypothetical protein
MHGIGQGNGAGPAIWAAVSTPILNMLQSQGLGCQIISPFSNQITKFVCYSFVDDMDLIISKPSLQCAQQVLSELQRSVDTWEGGLKATCGALVPEKTYCVRIYQHLSRSTYMARANGYTAGRSAPQPDKDRTARAGLAGILHTMHPA